MANLHQAFPACYNYTLNLFDFNGHSFRNGGVTTATQKGAEDSNIEPIEKCSMQDIHQATKASVASNG